MGFFTQNPPALPPAPATYDPGHMNNLVKVLRLFFVQQNAVQNISVSGMNMDINRLPTDVVYATLRSGDVYRDTTAGNVLKVKP